MLLPLTFEVCCCCSAVKLHLQPLVLWDWVSLCSSDWSWTWYIHSPGCPLTHHLVSSFQVLGWITHTMMLSSSTFFIFNSFRILLFSLWLLAVFGTEKCGLGLKPRSPISRLARKLWTKCSLSGSVSFYYSELGKSPLLSFLISTLWFWYPCSQNPPGRVLAIGQGKKLEERIFLSVFS